MLSSIISKIVFKQKFLKEMIFNISESSPEEMHTERCAQKV